MAEPTRAQALIAVGRRFYGRNWVLATSGNFSMVSSVSPLRLLITQSGAHKGTLTVGQFLTIDASGRATGRTKVRPSAEALIHLEIVQARGAGAVLHTHSVWSTVLSDRHAAARGIAIQGLEMLKGLEGVTTHTHREWVPIVENDQDMPRLRRVVGQLLRDQPPVHGFLLRGHGLYAWGRSLADAERHVETLEFLFQVLGERHGLGPHS